MTKSDHECHFLAILRCKMCAKQVTCIKLTNIPLLCTINIVLEPFHHRQEQIVAAKQVAHTIQENVCTSWGSSNNPVKKSPSYRFNVAAKNGDNRKKEDKQINYLKRNDEVTFFPLTSLQVYTYMTGFSVVFCTSKVSRETKVCYFYYKIFSN